MVLVTEEQTLDEEGNVSTELTEEEADLREYFR